VGLILLPNKDQYSPKRAEFDLRAEMSPMVDYKRHLMGIFWLRLCTNGLNGRLNQTLVGLVK